MLTNYNFSSDWVSSKSNVWNQVIEKTGKKKSILEIGSFEGRSTIWFLENASVDTGNITCIDNWDWDTKDIFNSNLSLYIKDTSKSYNRIDEPSYKALAKLISEDKKYDLVYIDAGHRTLDVITDACMSWYLIPSGGIIIFDDYLFRFKEDNLDQSVKLAVDAFCNLFNGYFVYLYVGNQVIIQKK